MLNNDATTGTSSWDVRFLDTGSASNTFACGHHNWHLDSLRGTNRNQRVEHVRCLMCGERRTRVWLDLPKAPRPDREYRRAA